MELKKGRLMLTFPHEKGKCKIDWTPVTGNGIIQRFKLKERGIKYPITAPELSSLVGEVYLHGGEEFPVKRMRILENFYFGNSTENLWFPKSESNKEFRNGVVVYDNPDLENPIFSIKKSELLKKLEDAKRINVGGHPVFISKDKSVRYTPFGFKTGEMNGSELAKNPYNVALHLERGAENVAQFFENYKKDPYLFAHKEGELGGEERTMSAMNVDGGFSRNLCADGLSSGFKRGCSLGVISED